MLTGNRINLILYLKLRIDFEKLACTMSSRLQRHLPHLHALYRLKLSHMCYSETAYYHEQLMLRPSNIYIVALTLTCDDRQLYNQKVLGEGGRGKIKEMEDEAKHE